MQSNHKRAVESFVVSIAAQTTMPTSGTLVNTSTGNVNLANGQLGIVNVAAVGGSVARNAFTDATPTITEAPVIAIAQGTSASAGVGSATSTYPLSVRPYEITKAIDGRNKTITVTKQPFRLAAHNVWTVGTPTGTTTGEINVLDETEYQVGISFRGRRIEEFYSREQAATLYVSKTTPNFTDLSTAIPRDWIVSHLVYEINRNSEAFQLGARYQGSDPVVAIACGVADSGPNGDPAGTEVATLTAGTSLSIFTYNGVARSILLTQEMVDSLKAAATASSFTHVFSVDLANAGTNVGGTATGFFLMGLDARRAFEDRIPQIKTRLRVSLSRGFDYTTVRNQESVDTDEGQGYGLILDMLYKATQGQRKYSQLHSEDPFIAYPSPFDTTQQYTVYNIHHTNFDSVGAHSHITSPAREIIAIPRYSSGTTANALIATFDTALNSWLASAGLPNIVTAD